MITNIIALTIRVGLATGKEVFVQGFFNRREAALLWNPKALSKGFGKYLFLNYGRQEDMKQGKKQRIGK